MPFNLPAYDVTRISIGPAVIYLGPAGAAPTIDVGAVRPGSQLVARRTVVDAEQGFPAIPVRSFVTKEEVQLSFTGIEWNLQNLQRAFGGGNYSTEAGPPQKEIFSFGGDINMQEVALKVVHKLPSGATEEIYVWRARGSGEIALNFQDNIHEFPYTFTALHSSTDWDGNALPEKEQLARIVHIK